MTSAEARLTELGIALPAVHPAMASYVATKRVGELVFVSGHGPFRIDENSRIPGKQTREISMPEDASSLITGKVDGDISLDEAREAARCVGLFLLSALRAEAGSLDGVRSIAKVFGMVNSSPGFTSAPNVIDACSELLVEVFGDEIGRHARSAVGVAELPYNIAVEIELVAAVAV
ncbi:MAG: RidA family protein [Solirubrobacteraceae bacterium]